MSSLAWPPKDPDDVLDFTLDVSAILAADGDTISSVTWNMPAGLTLDSQAQDAGKCVAWISGGEDGVRYPIGFHMITAGGRTYDRTVELVVREA